MPTAQRTSVQQLTTTEAAVLALLAIEGERSGYDLMKAVTQAIGHIWSPARSGLYAALPRLVKLGLAQSRAVAQSSRPDKHAVPHHARRAGRARRVARDGRAGRARHVLPQALRRRPHDAGRAARHVEQFIADCEARLDEYRAIEPTNSNRGHDWYHRHLLRHGLERTEQELAWADGVARALRRGPR